MDFITQTMLGAVASQTTMTRTLGRWAAPLGAAGGLLPDLDFLLKPWTDPALPFELHRHFTHALVFIPVATLLALIPFLIFPKIRKNLGLACLAVFIGVATHGLLDQLTSYGTHLFWPFIAERTTWDAMPIVDPIFSGVLLLGMLIAFAFGKTRPAQIAFCFCLVYIGLGFVQHERGLSAQRALAESRGHVIERGRVLPSVLNVILWRSVYEHDGVLYADAIRAPIFGGVEVREGESMPVFTVGDLDPDTPNAERVRDVYERFSMFADDYIILIDDDPADDAIFAADVRFCLPTEGFTAFWGLHINPMDDANPAYFSGHGGGPGRSDRDRNDALNQLWRDIIGESEGWRTMGDNPDVKSASFTQSPPAGE